MADATVLDAYARLSREKEAVEAEIAAIVEELTSGVSPAGVSGPLVDAEGFPRADIDVYRVRHQRHNLACRQTDHKAVMRRIEDILPLVFEARRAQQNERSASEQAPPPQLPPSPAPPVSVAEAAKPALAPSVIDAADCAKEPFAVVENVQDDSPAAAADLRAGDQVLVFGTADASNHRDLDAVKEIVARNVGSAIRVLVRRRQAKVPSDDWVWHELLLTPQQWGGPGVLGCLLMPVTIERP